MFSLLLGKTNNSDVWIEISCWRTARKYSLAHIWDAEDRIWNSTTKTANHVHLYPGPSLSAMAHVCQEWQKWANNKLCELLFRGIKYGIKNKRWKNCSIKKSWISTGRESFGRSQQSWSQDVLRYVHGGCQCRNCAGTLLFCSSCIETNLNQFGRKLEQLY